MADDGPARDVDPRSLPRPARWALRWERRLRSASLPRPLRSGDDPATPSRLALVAILICVAAGAYLALRAPDGSSIRWLAAVGAAAVYSGSVLGAEPGTMARPRFGPWLPAAGSWLAGIGVLEAVLRGWSGTGAGLLQAVLALGMGVVVWGKARLEHEW